ncbi:MAG: hypothetical protein N2738_09150 [Thermodesulfovibrionales bacterium]|nr:hypothetical protein [Thermodesulfovibrionales bacterium]
MGSFHRFSLFFFLFLIISTFAYANESQVSKATTFSFSASYLYQFKSNIDNGMDFKVNRGLLRADIKTRQSENLITGIGINYDLFDYSFGNLEKISPIKPWKTVYDMNLSANLLYLVDENMRLFISPSFGVAKESGASFGDSLVYGSAGWVSYKFSPNLVLGLGAGIFKKPDKVSVYPIVIVDWGVSSDIKLSNPLTPGPTGPAGLELSYALSNDLRIGGGLAYRSLRFRLDDRDNLKNGIGEDRGFPIWMRISYKAFKSGSIDFFGGAMMAGRLKIENDDSKDIMRENYKPAPFVALTLSMRL